MGGYLAGRLRTKWTTIHTGEVYFRDTAHGFLVWAVGLVITVSFLASSASSMVVGSAPARGNAGPTLTLASEAPIGLNLEPNAYFVDTLFRSDHPGPLRGDIYGAPKLRAFLLTRCDKGIFQPTTGPIWLD